MNLQKLRVLCEVVERGSLTAAAERLYVSQPVVSAHIRDLEREFGAKLLVKDGRRMAPTEAGRAVYAYALEIERATVEAKRLAAALETGEAGCVTIGASYAAAGYLLPAQIVGFKALHPRVEIRLGASDSPEAFDRVRRGVYDFAVVTSSPPPPTLHAETLHHEPLVIAAAPNHPLATAHALDPALLRDEQIIYPFFEATQAWTDARLRELGVPKLRAGMALGSFEAIKTVVAAGLGIAVLHRCCVEAELRAGTLVALDLAVSLPNQPVFLVHNPGKTFAPVHLRMLAFLRTSAALRRAMPGRPASGAPAVHPEVD